MLKISATLALTLTLSSAVELESDFNRNCISGISCLEFIETLYYPGRYIGERALPCACYRVQINPRSGDGDLDQQYIDSKEAR